jgi:hypothetical protein
MRRLFSIAALTLITTIPALAQEDDIDAAMKKAMENANQPASKADMKKLEQSNLTSGLGAAGPAIHTVRSGCAQISRR